MAIRGVPQLKRRMRAVLTGVIPEKAERAVQAAAVTGGALANSYAPVEYGFLRGSQYRKVESQGTRKVGMVAYTAAYAAAVHESSGTLTGQPRPSGRGNYWDPDAQPGFLSKGFEDADIDAVVEKAMKL